MPANVIPRGGRWAARVTVGGKQVWLGTHDTSELAHAAVRRARGRAAGLCEPTVRALAESWNDLDPRQRTEGTDAHRAAMVAAFVRVHGRLHLESVSPQIAQLWATAHPGSVRYLKAMFAVAVRLELLERNVWERVEFEPEKRPRRPFTDEEVDRLARAAMLEWRGDYGREVADLYLVAAAGGLRLSEAATARVCDVRGPNRLSVEGKGSKRRTALLLGLGHEALRRRLDAAVRGAWRPLMAVEDMQQLETLLFRSEKGRPLSRSTVSRMHARVVKRAGIVDAPTFHGLRHFYASTLLDAGGSSEDVAIAMGHTDEQGRPDVRQLHETYGHMSERRALDRLEKITKEGSTDGSADGGGEAGGAREARAG